MSVITHRDQEQPRPPTLDRYFARTEPKPGAWRRTLALAKRYYGPLLVYAVLGIALIAALAIRIAVWVPL